MSASKLKGFRPNPQLSTRVARIAEADRRFFARFPDRTARLRLAASCEIAQLAIVTGKPCRAAQGRRWCVVVGLIEDPVEPLLWIFGTCPEGFDTDLDEETCADTFAGAQDYAASMDVPPVWGGGL